jgi:hypothetical protein
MNRLSSLQTSRQDYVDGTIFKMIQSLNPTPQPIEWDIEMLGDIRDTVEDWVVNKLKMCTAKEFYPYVEDNNGN